MRASAALLALLVATACGSASPPPGDGPEQPPRGVLYLAGDGELTVVDAGVGTARVVRLPELSPGDPPHRIVRAGKRLVLYGRGAVYTSDLRLAAPPRRLSEGWFFLPSATPGRVWVAVLDRESPETERGLAALREVTARGRVTAEVPAPGGRWPAASVGRALVFETDAGLEVWDTATRRVVRTLPGVVAGPGHGTRLPWCAGDERRLRVTDLGTGAELELATPDNFAVFDCSSATISPDGRLLAVPVAVAEGAEAARALALVDLERGSVAALPGSRVPPGYVFVAWSTDGESVFLTGGRRFEPRTLVGYRVGADRAVTLPVAVGDFYGLAAS